jgi:hypothetical protein
MLAAAHLAADPVIAPPINKHGCGVTHRIGGPVHGSPAARTVLTVLHVEHVQGIVRCGNEMSEF